MEATLVTLGLPTNEAPIGFFAMDHSLHRFCRWLRFPTGGSAVGSAPAGAHFERIASDSSLFFVNSLLVVLVVVLVTSPQIAYGGARSRLRFGSRRILCFRFPARSVRDLGCKWRHARLAQRPSGMESCTGCDGRMCQWNPFRSGFSCSQRTKERLRMTATRY